MTYRPTRRTFIRHTATAGAALPLAMPRLARAASPNEKLNIACVGTNGRARADIRGVRSQNLVAFADVDARYLNNIKSDYPKSNTYTDYRRMLDREQRNIDAVVVATPDHQHAQAGLRAMEMGKHLYCEKPLAHSLEEIRMMRESANRNRVATQMGTQIHATDHYRRMVELIRSGAIGPVRQVHIWQGGAYSGGRLTGQPDPVPSTLDWDLWVGPSEQRPYYDKVYHPNSWRGWWDFGTGVLGDIACHVLDLPYWALDLRHPQTVQASGKPPRPERPRESLRVDYTYPARGNQPPLDYAWYDGGAHVEAGVIERFGIPDKWRSARNILFVGERGNLLTGYSKHLLLPEERFADFQPPEKTIPASPGHHEEWINACKGGEPALCNFDYAAPMAGAVLLGIVSHRAGNVKFNYDAESNTTDNAKANEFMTRPYRKGWEIGKLVG